MDTERIQVSQVSPLKEQYEESKKSIEKLENYRRELEENTQQLIRVFVLSIAAIITAFSFTDITQVENILDNQICSMRFIDICVESGWLLGLFTISSLTALVGVIMVYSSTRGNVRTVRGDISDVLHYDYHPEEFLITRLHNFRKRYELEYIATGIVKVSSSVVIYSIIVVILTIVIFFYNVISGRPLVGLATLPFISPIIALSIYIGKGLWNIHILVNKFEEIQETNPMEIVNEDREHFDMIINDQF